jgi:hypothetical protein
MDISKVSMCLGMEAHLVLLRDMFAETLVPRVQRDLLVARDIVVAWNTSSAKQRQKVHRELDE